MKRPLVIILLFAIPARIPGLFGPPWYDESYSLLLARLPFVRMIAATATDVHPPGWYILLWGWVRIFGENPALARILSVIPTLIVVWLAYRLLAYLEVSEKNRLALTALVAMSPSMVYYANEIRMYAWLVMLAMLAVYTGLDRRWFWHGLSVLGLIYCHNYGVIYAAVIGCFLLWKEQRISWPLVLSYVIPAVLFLPWAAALFWQMQNVFASGNGHWIQPPNFSDFVILIQLLLLWGRSDFTMIGVVIIAGMMAYSLVYAIRQKPRWYLPVLALGAAPLLIAVIISYAWKPIFLWRALLPVIFPWAILLFTPILENPTPRSRWIAFAMMIPVMVSGQTLQWTFRNHYRHTESAAVEYLVEHWQDGDIIYATNDGPHVNLLAAAPELPIYQLPECPGHNDLGGLTPATREALGIHLVDLDAIDYRRAWVFDTVGATTDTCRMAKADALVDGLEPVMVLREEDDMSAKVYLLEK